MSEIKNPDIFKMDDVSDEEMNEYYSDIITDFEEGELVTGTVVKIESDEILLDIGFKSEGVIPVKELSIRANVEAEDFVAIGDEIEALVFQKEDKDGRLILSRRRAEYERAWIDVEDKFKAGEIVEGEVIEIVKGGLILDIGLRGFLPASLVDMHRIKDLDSYLGTTIEARIIELDRNRNNVVLSRRVLLEEERKSERAEILGKLVVGMRLKGTVSSIVDFGTFVDLGGIDGLVYISELSWSHVTHPSEVVKVGQEVEVEVLAVDTDRERISLGLKQTQEDPWRKTASAFPVDSIAEGTVTKLVPFGIFVELGDGVEGLVHISEMASRHVAMPSQVVRAGDKINVKVMAIDLDKRRISLSMRAAAEELGLIIEVAELKGDEASQIDGATSDADISEMEAYAADFAEITTTKTTEEASMADESSESAQTSSIQSSPSSELDELSTSEGHSESVEALPSTPIEEEKVEEVSQTDNEQLASEEEQSFTSAVAEELSSDLSESVEAPPSEPDETEGAETL